MIQEERRTLILKALEQSPLLKLEDLSLRLGVSIDTIRRDLKSMDRDGLLQYIRGGAKALRRKEQFYSFKGREIINIELKKEASRKALEWVKKGDVIFLNSGTTNTIFARELTRAMIPCTVITNNIAAATAAAANPRCTVQVLGGLLSAEEQSTCGADCLRQVASLYPDLCFLSVNSLELTAGMTDFRMQEIPIMQTAVRNARQCAAIMDSTKAGRIAKRQVFPPQSMPPIFMDNRIPPEEKAKYLAKGIEIL